MRARCALLVAILATASPILSASDLNQQTLKAWNAHIQTTNLRMQQRVSGTTPFLWLDDAPGRRERVRQGEIVAEPACNDGPEKVPEGLIHHWLGAVFIPNTTIGGVFDVLNDYSRYDKFFNPAVVRARLLEDSRDNRKFSMVLVEKAPFVTAAVESEYSTQTIRVDDHHWYTISYSTRIQQIDDYGRAQEHELPPDQGAGYVWRLFSIERFEESDGGVYAELEAIALSRNIPLAIQWLVKPILKHLPRSSMIGTLTKTRDAVRAEANPGTEEFAGFRQAPTAGSGSTGKAPAPDRRGYRKPQTPEPIPSASEVSYRDKPN